MKRTLTFIVSGVFLFLLFCIPVFAQTSPEEDLQSKFTKTFDESCFPIKMTIPEVPAKQIIKVQLPFTHIFPVQEGKILPTKLLSSPEKEISYTIISPTKQTNKDIQYITDGNKQTSFNFDAYADQKKEITLKLAKKIGKGTVFPDFLFSQYGQVEMRIADDTENYIKVSDISQYDFSYLQLIFLDNQKEGITYNPQIHEIRFLEKGNTIILIQTESSMPITIYANTSCGETKDFASFLAVYAEKNKKTTFPIDAQTPIFTPVQEKNPTYSVVRADYDNDGTLDFEDNCPTTVNINQKDSNADGVGDICADDDNDGIIGSEDNCPTIANADQKDVNTNGVGDVCEFDADNDGIPDGIDNCIHTPNATQEDTDEDKIGNTCDNCNLYNPNQRDTNYDGTGDACEERIEFIQKNDADKDGKLDFEDNCPKVINPDQIDSDKDNVGNACDNCPDIQNTDQKDLDKNGIWDQCEDSDNDTIIWYLDNCVSIANTDQKDADNDGVGDVCEDDDRDGILAQDDNCPTTYNPNQMDVDNDKKGDACDSKDDRFIESNKRFFGWIIIILVIIFGIGIGFMVKKIEKK